MHRSPPTDHRRRPSSIFGIWLVLLTASGLLGCRNTAIVGQTDPSDAETATDGGGDATRDARVAEDTGTSDAGRPDVETPDTGADLDVGVDADIDAGGECPRPWAMVVAHTSAETRVERFSFSTGEPERCPPLRGEGTLLRSSQDVAALDENLVAVVSHEQVVAINVADDTVRWRRDISVFEDLQAFALRTSPPWLGIQSRRPGSSTPRLIGIDADGTAERDWSSQPPNAEGISAYPEAPWAIGGNRFNTLHVFDPFSGATSEEIEISHSQTWSLHVSDTSPPGISFGGRGNPIVSGHLGSELVLRSLVECRPQESAPSPILSDKILVVCGTGSSASLRLFEGETSTVLLSANAGEPDLEFSSLGLAP